MISERLQNKIKISCSKNILPLVLVDWLLNGSIKDKEDTYCILNDLDSCINILNGIYGQIHNKIEASQVRKDLFKNLKIVLSQNDKYGDLSTKNRTYIEIRGWILPIFAKTSNLVEDECRELLDNFLDSETDIATKFWATYSYIELNQNLPEKMTSLREKYRENSNRIYWITLLWSMNNNENFDTYYSEIKDLLEGDDIKKQLEFFICLSYYNCFKIVKLLTNFLENIIRLELDDCWSECKMNLYKYVLTSISNLGVKKYKVNIGQDQENFSYLLTRFLFLTRNYSGRIWNEVRLQLLRGIRIYYKTNKKIIIDNLESELINYDLAMTCDTCKTLYVIYGILDCTKIVIDVLTRLKRNNPVIDDKIIIGVSYGLKLISLKNNDIFNILDDILSNSNNHEEKNIVRILLTEMGGFNAINKLKENQNLREKYMAMTGNAQEKVESMFHSSILDAKKGFKISLYMNVAIFILGFMLISISGFMAIFHGNEDNWAGIGISTGTGFLSVIYSLFINRPSRKIRKSTNHLMRLKVIFLGYLRELTQMDQTFSKQLLDPEPISQSILRSYISNINRSMNSALRALRWEEYLGNDQELDTEDNLDNIENIDNSNLQIKNTTSEDQPQQVNINMETTQL